MTRAAAIPNGSSAFPSISADGRYVAFESVASDLVTGDGNDNSDVFVWDLVTPSTRRVSVDTGGGDPDSFSQRPSISADGRYVAFESNASDLVAEDGNSYRDVFVRDLEAGTTTRVDVDTSGGPTGGDSALASISADGRWVTFSSFASDLVAGDGNGTWDIFLRDRDVVPSPSDSLVFDGDPATTERIDEPSPSDAAISMAESRFAEDQAGYVVLSRDDNFPDSLAASALTDGGPLMFTATAALTPATRTEIDRLLPAGARIYLLGGTAAIGQAVEDELIAAGYDVVRLSGPSRIETAIAVANEVRRLNPGVTRVALARAYGTDENPTAAWADSVTGGAWAARDGVPIVVTQTDGLHDAVAAWLSAVNPVQTVLLGGLAALSATVEGSVPNPLRVSGAARDGTAAAIATTLMGAPTSGPRRFTLVNAYALDGWAYGLAAGGLAAGADAPVLVVHPDSVPPDTASLLGSCGAPEVDVLLIGGEVVISAARVAELDQLDGDAC